MRKRLLYYDAAGRSQLCVEGNSVLVREPSRATRRLPLRDISRAVVRNPSGALLDVALEVCRHGGTVHFQDGRGVAIAVLRPTTAMDQPIWRELATLIEEYGSSGPIARWRDDQWRHAFSTRLHKGASGPPEKLHDAMLRYTLRVVKVPDIEQEWREVHAQLWCWTQARIVEEGLGVVAEAIGTRGFCLTTILVKAMELTALWEFAKWRRRQSTTLPLKSIIAFVEMLGISQLIDQFHRHIDALWYHYDAGSSGPLREVSR